MKRVISLFIVMLIMSSAVYAQGILNSGTIDGMINWTVYNDGKLTIEGSGAIADYSSSSSVPWYQNRNAITSLELNGSITLIGKYAFYACTNITQITTTVTPPPTLTSTTFSSSHLSSITLFVQSMFMTEYQSAEFWGQMKISPTDGGVMGDSNAYLSAIYVDGTLIDGFEPYTFAYQVELPEGTSTAPNVTYMLQDESCMLEVQQADSPNGFAKITVTSSDGSMTNTYQITFSVTETDGNPNPDLVEEYNVNFALASYGSSATASSGDAMLAIDDDESTRWESSSQEGETWTLNMGQNRIFNTIRIYWEGAYCSQYELTYSYDDVTYYPLYTESNLTNSGWQEVMLQQKTTARYIKFNGIRRATNYGQSFYEFQVMLTEDQGNTKNPDTVAPTPTWPIESVRAIYSPTYSADCTFEDWASGTTMIEDSYGKVFTTNSMGYFGLTGFTLNCLDMEALHLDIWATEKASIRVVPIWEGAEQGITVQLESNKWNSIDISKEQYTEINDWSNIYQLKIDNAFNQKFWIGNIYFYQSSGSGSNPDVIADGYFGGGDGLYWQLYGNGQLTIDGVGDISDFSDENMQPWANFRDQIYDVNFNAQTTKVGNYAFAQCSNLNTVTLASSTNQIGDFAFSECSSLTRITVPANEVISASELAFGYSFDREKMTIEVPESMVDAYKGAMFWYEFNVVAIGGSSGGDSIVDGLVEGDIRWSFNSNTGLLSIYGFGAMPDYIASMAPWGDYVDAIQKVEVCYGITYVCNGAFANCPNITSVTTAASVDSIGENIFTGNNSPIQFYVQSMTPPGITENTFANVNGCVYAYCYESAFTAYDSNSLWNNGVCLGYVDDPQDPDLREYQLQMIYINNVALADYNPNLYNYDITLPAGSDAPLVTYKPGYTTQSITVEQASSPEGTAYIHVNGDATYSLYFAVDGGSQQGDDVVTIALDTNWHFIMLPQFGGINYEDITTDSEVLWAIYDGEQRAGGQSGWKIVDFVTTYYKDWAHIVRAVEGNATLTINLKGNKNNQPINFELRHFDASHAENANWNFIGNPYYAGYDINGLVAAGIESPITVWNGTGYNIYTPGIDQYTLQPFEPFFIQLSDDQQSGTIQLSPEYVDESMSLIDSGNGGNGSDPIGGNESSQTYTFLTKAWDADEGSWMSGMNGYGFTNDRGVQCTTSTSGTNAQCPITYSNISTVIVTYCTNSNTAGAGTIMIEINGFNQTQEVTSSGGTTLREMVFDFVDSMPSGAPSIMVNCTANSIYIYSVTIITK